MLLRNGNYFAATPARFLGAASIIVANPAGWKQAGAAINRLAGPAAVSGETDRHSIPSGYLHPTAWALPTKPGGLGSRGRVGGQVAIQANLAMGVALSSDPVGAGTVASAPLNLVVQLTCDASGAGDVTYAEVVGVTQMACDAQGSGGITAAGATGVSFLASDASGVGAAAADMLCLGHMSSDVVVTGSTLTTSNVGTAVWSTLLAPFTTADQAGLYLKAAGASGDPWSTALPGSYPAGTAGKIIGDRLDAAVGSRAAAGDAMSLTPSERDAVADAHLDRADGVTSDLTPRQLHRVLLAVMAGLVSGANTALEVFKDPVTGDTVVEVAVDIDGNRTSIHLTP